MLIKDKELLKPYNKIWKKVKNTIDKEFDSDPVYNWKYLKAKLKSYNGIINKISIVIKYQIKVLNVFTYK